MNIVIYLQVSQRDIMNTIDREMSGDLRAGFKCIGELWFQISMFASILILQSNFNADGKLFLFWIEPS